MSEGDHDTSKIASNERRLTRIEDALELLHRDMKEIHELRTEYVKLETKVRAAVLAGQIITGALGVVVLIIEIIRAIK